MASMVLCRCGHHLRKNLFEGHGLRLLVPEELIDQAGAASLDDVLDDIVQRSAVVMSCPECHALTVEQPDGSYLQYGLLDE